MFDPIFSGVIIVLYIDVVNLIFCITMMIVVKVLPRDSFNGLGFIIMGLN